MYLLKSALMLSSNKKYLNNSCQIFYLYETYVFIIKYLNKIIGFVINLFIILTHIISNSTIDIVYLFIYITIYLHN